MRFTIGKTYISSMDVKYKCVAVSGKHIGFKLISNPTDRIDWFTYEYVSKYWKELQ